MSPFVSRITNNQNWILPVSGMCLILGFMISMAWVTGSTRKSRLDLLQANQRVRIGEASLDIDGFQQLSQEVSKLREEKTKLENALASSSGQSKVLNESLQDAKVFGGLTPVEGPGIVITLSDSEKMASGPGGAQFATNDQIIHDTDVLRVVNELWNAGAEAIEVNRHRVGPRTSFRCVGTTILVNDIKIASPVRIRAVGDPAELAGAMNMPGGFLGEIRALDPAMVRLDRVALMTLEPYAGQTELRYAKVPKVKK